MSKTLRIVLIVLLVLVAAGGITWAVLMNRSVPSSAQLIPQNAFMVVTADLKDMVQKADLLSWAQDSKLLAEIQKQMEAQQSEGEGSDLDPTSSGISPFSDLLGFTLMEGDADNASLGLTLNLLSREDFEEFVPRVLEQQDFLVNNLKKESSEAGYTLFTFDTPDMPMVVINNDDHALLLARTKGAPADLKELAISCIQRTKENSILADVNFRDFYERAGDISLFLSLGHAGELSEKLKQEAAFLSESQSAMDINFEKGRITLNSWSYPGKNNAQADSGNYMQPGARPELIQQVPAKLLAGMSYAIEVDRLLELLMEIKSVRKQIEGMQAQGVDIKNYLELWDGQLLAAMNDYELVMDTTEKVVGFNMETFEPLKEQVVEEKPRPQFAFVLGATEAFSLDSLMDLYGASLPHQQLGDGYSMKLPMVGPMMMTQREDVLLLTNQAALLQSEAPEASLSDADHSESIQQNAMYLFVDLDLEHYPEEAVQLARERAAARFVHVEQTLALFESMSFSTDAQLGETQGELLFTKQDENSLKQLLQFMDSKTELLLAL